MIAFRLEHQQRIFQRYQGVNISKFSFTDSDVISNDGLIDQFIQSSAYSYDSLPEIVKQNPDEPYLRQAFKSVLLSVGDFKNATKEEVIKFLEELKNEEKWGENDRDEFIYIKDEFLNNLYSINSESFYIISKDWFEEGNPKVKELEAWIYIYYFQILWIDKGNSTITLSEWAYD